MACLAAKAAEYADFAGSLGDPTLRALARPMSMMATTTRPRTSTTVRMEVSEAVVGASMT